MFIWYARSMHWSYRSSCLVVVGDSGQFCDSDLEVAFRKHSCYVRTKDGVDLLKGSWGSNLYTISVEDMMKSSPICLLSKASKNNSWLWHRQLNYLNFSTINDLARKDLVRGLPRLKFEKDHLCSAGSLEDIPKINTTKIEYLYAKEHNIQERNKIQVLKDIENEAVRLLMFPLSLTGEVKTRLNELNEGTIETWDELQTAFISRFSPSNIIKIFYHGLNEITQEVLNDAAGGIFLYKTPNLAYQLLEDKVLLKLDWAKNQKTKTSLKKTVAFADKGSSNTDTDKIMARMDAVIIKMDAQYKELQSRAKQPIEGVEE
ncbi:reverse transcriptase domain-containing protein [Tanacetum coccineum]